MNNCKICALSVAFGAGLLAASALPAKAVCIIAAIVLLITCLTTRR